MKQPYVHDKAEYHLESVEDSGLPEKQASNHTVFFLRWLIENDLMSEFFMEEWRSVLRKFRAGNATIHQVHEWGDCCLIDDMLSAEGNKFAMHYFDFDGGEYIYDYIDLLQGSLPTEFHIKYNEANYKRMKKVIDGRYQEWKTPKKKPKKKSAKKKRRSS